MMENKDLLEEMLKEEFDRLAKEEEDVIQEDDISMPEGLADELYDEIQGKIHEVEKDNIYAQLSEEDLKALELGRKIMEEEVRAEREAKAVRKKKRVRMYLSLAAVLVLAMALSVTSMGGPERIIQMMTRMVGDREVVQIDSKEDNLITKDDEEEEAYQKIRNVFGCDVARIFLRPKEMKFSKMEIDEELQVAEIYYSYNSEKITYFVNASYSSMSIGIDIEDDIIDVYSKEIKGNEVEVKEYKIQESEKQRFSARFKYRGLEYFLIGTMNRDDFEYILENLYFFNQ